MKMPVKHQPHVEIVSDIDKVSARACEIFLADARSAIAARGVFYIAISGGHTPVRFFEMLSEIQDASVWQNTQLFWVDERYVPADVEGSNYKLANETFLTRVPLPPENIHRISTEYNDFSQAVAEYEQAIRKTFDLDKDAVPQFDLIMLGMGPDGHTGSLFPDSYASFDSQDMVCVVYTMEKFNRITLTYPVLRAAKHLVVLVAGREKAEIIKTVFTTEQDEVKYPIHILWPVLDKVTWLVDTDAAKLL